MHLREFSHFYVIQNVFKSDFLELMITIIRITFLIKNEKTQELIFYF